MKRLALALALAYRLSRVGARPGRLRGRVRARSGDGAACATHAPAPHPAHGERPARPRSAPAGDAKGWGHEVEEGSSAENIIVTIVESSNGNTEGQGESQGQGQGQGERTTLTIFWDCARYCCWRSRFSLRLRRWSEQCTGSELVRMEGFQGKV